MIDKKLLAILACPLCKGPVHYDATAQELLCFADSLAYQIRDGIPVMLDTEARTMTAEEKEKRRPK